MRGKMVENTNRLSSSRRRGSTSHRTFLTSREKKRKQKEKQKRKKQKRTPTFISRDICGCPFFCYRQVFLTARNPRIIRKRVLSGINSLWHIKQLSWVLSREKQDTHKLINQKVDFHFSPIATPSFETGAKSMEALNHKGTKTTKEKKSSSLCSLWFPSSQRKTGEKNRIPTNLSTKIWISLFLLFFQLRNLWVSCTSFSPNQPAPDKTFISFKRVHGCLFLFQLYVHCVFQKKRPPPELCHSRYPISSQSIMEVVTIN